MYCVKGVLPSMGEYSENVSTALNNHVCEKLFKLGIVRPLYRTIASVRAYGYRLGK